MFATLVGSNSNHAGVHGFVDRLVGLACERGFVGPDSDLPVRGDEQGSLDGWAVEQRGPREGPSDFLLAVTAPRVPGMSPIYPFMQTVEAPLFAVVVCDSWFVVSRAGERDVTEAEDFDSVERMFVGFLDRHQGVTA